MIRYEIPGRMDIEIEHIVFDYNGTIAVNGKLIEGVKEELEVLSKVAEVYILTADTYGTVREECGSMNVEVLTFPRENAGEAKRKIVEELGKEKTLCLGNGYNDIPMFEESVLSIAIMEGEGLSGKLLSRADIVCRNIIDALNIIKNKDMVKATLRN